MMRNELGFTARQVSATIMIAASVVAVTPSRACCRALVPSPIGVWETPDGASRIRITFCGASLCGTIVWLRDPQSENGGAALDSKNPNPRLRSRRLIGLLLLHGFVQGPDDQKLWGSGKIYDPSDGKTYSCQITAVDARTLQVRGYVGLSMFGVTQIWRRIE
jgi:uncharacterized protein (DUF2147 family)